MFPNKNERLALYIAVLIFTVVAIGQFWRAFAQIPVAFGATAVPLWTSFVVGLIALAMAGWLSNILRHHRPMI